MHQYRIENRIDGLESIPTNGSLSPTNESNISKLSHTTLVSKVQKDEVEADISHAKPHIDTKKLGLEEPNDKFSPLSITKHFPVAQMNNNNNE